MRYMLMLWFCLCAGELAQAKVKAAPAFDGRLISYGQLMTLSPQKRAAYLQDVAALLVEMEKSQRIYEVAGSEVNRLQDQLASLMNLMSVFPDAAAEPGRKGAQSGKAVEDECGDYLVWSRYTRSCVTSEMLTAQKAEEAAREARKAADAAVSKFMLPIGSGMIGSDGQMIGTPKLGLAGGPSGSEATQDCGKTLKWSRYSHNCVNEEILSAQKEESEAREARRIADQKAVKDPVYVGSGMIGSDGQMIGMPKQGLAGGPAGTEATQDCGKTLKWSRYSHNCVNDEILAAQKSDEEAHAARLAADKSVAKDIVVVGSGQVGPDGQPIGTPKQGLAGGPSGAASSNKCGDELKWSRFSESCVNDEILTAQKKEDEARDARKIADSTPPKEPSPELKSTGGEPPKEKPTQAKCEKPVLNCGSLDAQARDGAIVEFRADPSTNVCIAGGYFSQYESPKKAVGKCVVKTQIDRAGKKPIACAQPKDKGKRVAMCNPAVFCLGLKVDKKLNDLIKTDQDVKKVMTAAVLGTAATVEGETDKILPIHLCAPVGQDLTEQCNLSLKDHLEGRASKLKKGETYVACDPSKLSGFPLQNEYATLRQGVEEKYKAQCNNGQAKFTALFCSECKIISERIYGMNEKATGQGCAADVPAGPTDGGAPGSPRGVREKAGG